MRNSFANILLAAATVCMGLPTQGNAQGRSTSRWSFGKLDYSRYIPSRTKVNRTWFSVSHSSRNSFSSYYFHTNSYQGGGNSANSLPRNFPHEHRAIDGKGNNPGDPERGAAETPMLRLFVSDYADGESVPSGFGRPSARLISSTVCDQEVSIVNSARASDFLWQWGQFLDHDIDETPGADPQEAFDIEVPQGDPFFDPFNSGTQVIPLNRSGFIIDSNNVRQQVNAITSVIDASNVYGSDEERAHALRALDGSGKLKTTGPADAPMLPYNEEGFPNAGGPGAELFLAGDVRANEQIALTTMHILFVREHNYWAEKIAKQHRHLDGDAIYEKARTIVAAEMQSITFNEFLPLLLGKNAIRRYRGYDSAVDPSISNLFATAAYRVGHTMLSPEIQRLKEDGQPIAEGPIPLQNAFFRPDAIASGGGIDPLLRGLASQPAQQIDTQIIDAVRNFLFGPPGAGGFDLASLNIQRGRDHGLPGYNEVRRHFGLSALDSFAQYHEVEPGLAAKLELLYGTPENMDAWVGLLGEGHVHGALVGETLRAVLADQFTRLRDGDRFWYQNYLDRDFQKFVERQTLATIIRRNTGIKNIQNDVFRLRGRGNHSRPVRMKPWDFKDRHNRHYFGPDATSRRWKNYGFGKAIHEFSAILKQVSPIVNGAFSVEVNSKNAVKKSDFEISNGYVSGVSSVGNGRYFASINSNGNGPVSVSLGGKKLQSSGVDGSHGTSGINNLPEARPETVTLDLSTGYPGEVSFASTFRNPVVFVMIEKSDKKLPGLVTRIDDLTGVGAKVHLEVAGTGHKGAVSAKVRVLVLEAGTYSMGASGIQMTVGTTITSDRTNVALEHSYGKQPVVLSQVQSSNSDGPTASWAKLNGKQLKLEVQGHGPLEYETIGYAVIEPRQGSFRGMPYHAGIQKVGKNGSAIINSALGIKENTAVLIFPGDDDCKPAIRVRSNTRVEAYSQGSKMTPKSPVGYFIIGD